MTLVTGLLILAAIGVAAALSVLGTIAAAAEIFPSRFARGDDSVSAGAAAPRAPVLRGSRSQAPHPGA